MKIAQVCDYVAPARDAMGAERIVERISKGLVSLGHDVTMVLNTATQTCPVEGAKLAKAIPKSCDIVHYHGWEPEKYFQTHAPWITTIHGYQLHQEQELAKNDPRVVAVSEFAQKLMHLTRYVWNCSDEKEFTFQHHKDDYFLWLAGTDWSEQKGLFTTIHLAKRARFKLKIAGTGRNQQVIDIIRKQCDDRIEYLGAVNGKEKVSLLQNARALILLTQLPDACPVTVSEALMCGTPVIGSNYGSMPEIVQHNQTGFICKSPAEALAAMALIQRLKPSVCRDYAEQNFSISTCAKNYIKIYEDCIENFSKKYQRNIKAQNYNTNTRIYS